MSANLKRHLKHYHQQAFDRVEEKDSEVAKKNKLAERKRANMASFLKKVLKKLLQSSLKKILQSFLLVEVEVEAVEAEVISVEAEVISVEAEAVDEIAAYTSLVATPD